MDSACTFIFAAQCESRFGGGHQNTGGGLQTKNVSRVCDVLTQGNAVFGHKRKL
jgi:hypothetical protein